MAQQQLTEQDKKKIMDSVIASCISKGIKPTVTTSAGIVANPLYASCIQLGYADALSHASQGKLGLWFQKVNSFVQSQGGITGCYKVCLQSPINIAETLQIWLVRPSSLQVMIQVLKVVKEIIWDYGWLWSSY